MGWLLWGICKNRHLSQNLVLKGGNCLRKVYFPDTRFSDDLDFTAIRLDSNTVFREYLIDLCSIVQEASEIQFDIERTFVKEKQTPVKELKALDGRVYFRGFAGDSSIVMRIKFDISDFERIVLPLQRHPIIHNYSDSESLKISIQTYSLEEVLAEKLRSWIQRTRARDLFDVIKIVQSEAIPISKSNVLGAFFQKTIFKQIPNAGRDEMLYKPKFKTVQEHWPKTIVCPANASMIAVNAIQLFTDFVNVLFDPVFLESIGVSAIPGITHYDVRSGVREAIIKAGRARKLIRLQYRGLNRTIEPYSFRFKWTKKKVMGQNISMALIGQEGKLLRAYFYTRFKGSVFYLKSSSLDGMLSFKGSVRYQRSR